MVQCKKCKLFISLAKDDIVKCKGGCAGMFHKKCARSAVQNELCEECGKKGSPITPKISVELGKLTVENLLKEVNQKLEVVFKIESKLEELTTLVNFYSEKYAELADFREKTEAKLIALDRNNLYLQKCNKALEERVEMLEQKEKEKNVELAYVEEFENEKLDEVVKNIAKELDLKIDEIESVQRVGAPRKKKVDVNSGDKRKRPRPIVIKMRTKAARDQWIQKRKMRITNGTIYRTGSTQRIYINEEMTKYKRQLFWSTNNQLKNLYAYIWFQNSNVLVKKSETEDTIYTIKNEEDIKSH